MMRMSKRAVTGDDSFHSGVGQSWIVASMARRDWLAHSWLQLVLAVGGQAVPDRDRVPEAGEGGLARGGLAVRLAGRLVVGVGGVVSPAAVRALVAGPGGVVLVRGHRGLPRAVQGLEQPGRQRARARQRAEPGEQVLA